MHECTGCGFCYAALTPPCAVFRYLFNKLGGFFGLQPDEAEMEVGGKERACLIRMHIECVSKENTGRAHFVRRATLKDGDKLLFRAWEKEAMAQINDVFNTALGEPSVPGQSPADAEIAALKEEIADLEKRLANAQAAAPLAIAVPTQASTPRSARSFV